MSEQKHYRVLKLIIQNYMGIETAAVVSPDGKSIRISGPNGAGKTSTLNGVFAAITGKAPDVVEPVKEGEEQAILTVDLGESRKVDLRVIRKFGKGEGVIVEHADGSRMRQPQTVLNALYEPVSVDPESFARLPADKQAAILRGIVDLGDVDPDAVLAEIATTEEERRVQGRALRDTQGLVKTKQEQAPAEDPGAKTSATDLMQRRAAEDEKAKAKSVSLMAAKDAEAEHAKQQEHAEAMQGQHRLRSMRVQELEEALADARDDLAGAVERLKQAEDKVPVLRVAAEEKQREAEAMPGGQYAEIDAEIESLDEHNATVDAWTEYQTALRSQTAQQQRHTELDQKVTSLRASLKAALANASYPVEGMSMAEDMATVLYNGVPLSQAPTSIQLLVGVRIAAEQKPQLRVLRVQHGNNLDASNKAELLRLAEEHDFQVWFEEVANTGGLKFEAAEAPVELVEDDADRQVQELIDDEEAALSEIDEQIEEVWAE